MADEEREFIMKTSSKKVKSLLSETVIFLGGFCIFFLVSFGAISLFWEIIAKLISASFLFFSGRLLGEWMKEKAILREVGNALLKIEIPDPKKALVVLEMGVIIEAEKIRSIIILNSSGYENLEGYEGNYEEINESKLILGESDSADFLLGKKSKNRESN